TVANGRGSIEQRQLPCRVAGRGSRMTNLVIYLIGTLLVVAGLAYGANRLGVSHVWIIVGALVITGFGLMAGIVKTRQKDPAEGRGAYRSGRRSPLHEDVARRLPLDARAGGVGGGRVAACRRPD